jgi:hypothetical protein
MPSAHRPLGERPLGSGLASTGLRSVTLPLAGAAIVVGLIAAIYGEALRANFFDDDFHWLAKARRLEWGQLLELDRFDHFYRPVIEVYSGRAAPGGLRPDAVPSSQRRAARPQ